MTRTAAILAGITLLIMFAVFELFLFSLIDRSMDRAGNRMVLRDAKGAVMYQCYSPPKRNRTKSLTSKE